MVWLTEEHHHEHEAHHETHHAEHSESHRGLHEHAVSAPAKGVSNKALIFIATALVAGIVIGFAFAALSAPAPAALQYNSSASSAVALAAQSKISQEAASAKAIAYINDNFLSPRGLTAVLSNVSEKSGMYVISFKIMQGNETLQPAEAYVSFDGNTLLVGTAFDLNKKLELPTPTPSKPAEIPKSDKPDVKLFVMSFCPYGSQAQQIMYPVAKALASAVKVEPRFVIYSDYCAGNRCNAADYCIANGTLCSMHGINEVREDVRQLCIWKYQESKWLEYNNYVNTKCSLQNIESCWKDAAKAAGIDVENVTKCFESEAESLLKAEQSLDEEFGVVGSPTLVINGVQYEGARSASAFKDAICSAFNKPPAECSAEVNASVPAASSGACQ